MKTQCLCCVVLLTILLDLRAAHSGPDDLESEAKAILQHLETLDPNVFSTAKPVSEIEPRRQLIEYVKKRRRTFNASDVFAWRKIKTREQWEQFRSQRIDALRASLGPVINQRNELVVQTTKTLKGDGFEIDCLVFTTWPGMKVTANLYRPQQVGASAPGILICHSHHNPKTQGELQDMGMTWARQGCYVLVMDQIGHGERWQHPFRTADDFDKPFMVSRQDYYFRYNTGIQLHLIGDSLIGWMVSDLMHGVDLLLKQPNIDAKRIALLGAVAG
ncbi:MAG: hypothetical protein CMJ78_17135 [Planctomycetaceae bacterium]|nr:hypothetical protein [Planctomycetaceae bacterium]